MEIDKRSVYFKWKELIKEIKEDEIKLFDLQSLIATYIGSNERTINTAVRTMGMTGLIEDIGNGRFKIVKAE